MTHSLDEVRGAIQLFVNHMLTHHWQYEEVAIKVQRALDAPTPCTPQSPCRGCFMARARHK